MNLLESSIDKKVTMKQKRDKIINFNNKIEN